MKTALLLSTLTLVAALPAAWAVASSRDDCCPSVSSKCCDAPSRWAGRHDVRDARLAINTEEGDATLLLTDEVVAVQLSDRDVKKLRKKLHETEDEDSDNLIGHAIKVALFASLGDLFDHSAECPVRSIADVTYHKGTLVITTNQGDTLFDDIEINGDEVMSSFSEDHARAFVREFKKLKSRLH